MNHHDNNYLAYLNRPPIPYASSFGNVGNLARNVPGLFFHNPTTEAPWLPETVGTYTIQYEYDESTLN
jgi:hypothetical protein